MCAMIGSIGSSVYTDCDVSMRPLCTRIATSELFSNFDLHVKNWISETISRHIEAVWFINIRPFAASRSVRNYTRNEYSNDDTDDRESRYLRFLIPIAKFSVFLFVVSTLIDDGNGDDCLLHSVIVLCRCRAAGRRTHLTSWYSQCVENIHAPHSAYIDVLAEVPDGGQHNKMLVC